MRPRLRSCCIPLLLAPMLAVAARPAIAAPSRDPVVEAREHYELGTRLYDIGRYAEALDEYEKAYQVKPDAALLYNIGVCHRKLGHAQQALDAYRSFLRRQPKSPRRESVERIIATLEQEIAEASKTPAPAEVAPISPPPPLPPAPREQAETALAARAEPAPETTPLLRRPWVWVAAAAVVAGAGVAIALATSKTDRVFTCPDCQGTRAVP